MSSKYQIFVSSTYNDLKEPRDLVIKAILEMGHIPVGMEMFSAADEEQWSIIQRQIDQSDYYVLIMANRYGSVTAENISYTEKEYNYARSLQIPCLGFVLDPSASWPSHLTDTDSVQVESLNLFRAKVKQRPVSFWKNFDDLYGKCAVALMKAFITHPREGWVRASEYTDSKSTAELIRLSAENAKLRDELAKNQANAEERRVKSDRDFITTLRANKRPLHVWKKGATEYKNIKETSLYAIFKILAPDMQVEMSTENMGRNIAILLAGVPAPEIRNTHPMPTNSVKDWLADFSAMELVVPSAKKKPLSDTNEYWTLSEKGREGLALIRRVSLEIALDAPTVVDAASPGDMADVKAASQNPAT
ncbi:DUF4062 domain-containing protein [Pseudomonas alliivorans]|uniref:DUF4062 domain-containing protein n=1 Tax=Pseudomonas alliivorans TaxID=2810613 RepID=UPI001AE5043B|nr:DUF4062 domain-containing protein [Pseudomonas alliivorans]MBP0938975.1 DUF4062 domain-containing protein [Pseudomonas alliivorans]MEE4878046.1 DUF4062 domain-containing protein [Pseudomonas alliivorans]MEE4928411.1 DUF4062 domain-containing protein [Pseudomonas alliivorans]MEE4933826.1 DUF4062 domain-containing protein [Pseudomonas alliivorans]MEE4938958.1 DUF4062 domain-containing protein [Pseudomonas alliivorans]